MADGAGIGSIGAASLGSILTYALSQKDRENSAYQTKRAQDLLENQFAFQKSLTQNREGQRNEAIKGWMDVMKNQQAYKTPESVGKYVNLMQDLGGELSQLRDPSNKSQLNLSNYDAGITNYDQLKMNPEDIAKYLTIPTSNTPNSDNPLSGSINGTGGGSGRRDTGMTVPGTDYPVGVRGESDRPPKNPNTTRRGR